MVLISGEAGIGKSRLVSEAKAQSQDDDIVLTGHAVELAGGELPFGLLRSTLRGLAFRFKPERIESWVGASFPALSALLPGAQVAEVEPLYVIDAFAGLLTQLSTEHLTWWQVEDLHWADAESRDALRYVVQLMEPPSRLLVTCTMRTHDTPVPLPLSHLFAELARAPATQRIILRRLTSDQVSEQVSALRGESVNSGLVERVMALSQGVPFLTEELVAGGLTEEGPLPASASELMLARVQRLTADTQSAILAASLAEAALDEARLGAVTGLEPIRLEACLREAVDASVLAVEHTSATFRFHHALMQQAVAHAMLPSERARWHGRWARALTDAPAGQTDLALQVAEVHHWSGAGDLDRAFERALHAAGVAATSGAQGERAAMLCRALAWWPEIDEEARSKTNHDDLIEEAMWACSLSGAIDLGLQTCERELGRLEASPSSADLTGDNELRRLRLRLARRRLQEYDKSDERKGPRSNFEQDVEVLERCPRSLGFIRVLSDLVAEAHDVESSQRIAPLLTEGLALLSPTTPAFDRIDLLDTYAHHLKVLGRPEEAADQMSALLGEAEGQLLLTDLARVESNAVSHLHDAGRFADAAVIGRRSLQRLSDPRLAPRVWVHVAGNLADVLVELGDWDEAESCLDKIDEVGPPGLIAVVSQLDHAVLHARRGDVAAARHRLDASEQVRREAHSDTLDLVVRLLEAEIALVTGEARRAWSALDPTTTRLPPHEPGLARDALLLAAFSISGDEPRGRRAGEAELERRTALVRAAVAELPSTGHFDLVCRGHVGAELARAEGRDTANDWTAVVDGRRRTGQQYLLGWAQLRLAECLLAENRHDDAHAALTSVLAIAGSLRSLPLDSAARRLAQRGRIPIGPVKGSGDSTSDHALTAREREVLQLLSEGYSNDQIAQTLFISPKTASVHVSRILAKLGVRSRGEAAALARRDGSAPHA
jgi:DNA-binding NarL/FixJ family response regulator